MGIEHVVTVNAFDTKKLAEVVKEETARDAVSVIIAKAPCALLDKTPVKTQARVNPDLCRKCGVCLKPGCPALTKGEDGKTFVNDTMCNGCGLCVEYCKFGAISLVDVRR